VRDEIAITPATRAYLAAFDEWLHGAWKRDDTITQRAEELEQNKDNALDTLHAEQRDTLHDTEECHRCGAEIPEDEVGLRMYCKRCTRYFQLTPAERELVDSYEHE
jgi:hypothetical protein